MSVLKYKDPSTGTWITVGTGGGGGGSYTDEQVRDVVASFLVAGANVTLTHNDPADTLTVAASGGSGGGITTEDAVDAVAAALVEGTNIDIVYNDVANTITISATGGGSGDVPSTRTIATTLPLTGGGDLSANRTLNINTFTSTVRGAVPPPTTVTGKYLRDDGTWDTPAGGGGGAPVRRTLNAQTGTTYAPVVADENTMVTLSNAAAVVVTMPSNATQAFPVGAEVDFLWLGVGQPSFVAGSGATVNATPGLKLRGRYSAATAKKIGTDAWVVIGDLAT